jgi:hypothetical protein
MYSKNLNEIDYKLNERLKMFDDIDKMILNEKQVPNKQNNVQEKRMFIGDSSSYKNNSDLIISERNQQPSQKMIEKAKNNKVNETLNENVQKQQFYKERTENGSKSSLLNKVPLSSGINNNYIPKNISKGINHQLIDEGGVKASETRIKPVGSNTRNEVNYVPVKQNEKMLDVLNNFSYNNYYNNNSNQASKRTLREYENSPDRTTSTHATGKLNPTSNSKPKHMLSRENYNTNSNLNKRNMSNSNLKNDFNTDNISLSPSNYGNKSIDQYNNFGVIERGEKYKKKWDQKKEKSIDRSTFTPEITSKAKQLSRDPLKFPDRLYPAHKIKSKNENNHSQILSKSPSSSMLQMNDTSTDERMLKIYFKSKEKNYEKFDYQPKLDRKSLQMAKKLGDARERLTRKKSRAKTPAPEVRESQETTRRSKSPLSNNGKNRCLELYEKAQYQAKVKNDLILKKAREAENSHLQYSYHPSILEKSRSKSKSTDRLPLYDRLYQWEKVKNNKKEKIKEQRFNYDKENCTFHPNIEENRVCDDEAFINKNLQHIMSYIARKQKVIEKKKEDEKLYKKRFGYGENYVIKRTVPKEFNLSSNQMKNQPVQDPITKNHQQYLQDLNKIRSKMKTDNFFEQKINLTTDNNLFDENEGQYNMNNFDYSNLDQDQLAMAVNYLHQQLHND